MVILEQDIREQLGRVGRKDLAEKVNTIFPQHGINLPIEMFLEHQNVYRTSRGSTSLLISEIKSKL